MTLTVYYEGRYWVGVVQEEEEGRLRAGRFIFGTEPADAEVLEFISKHLTSLMESMTAEVEGKLMPTRRVNPKRLQRLAAEESRAHGAGSYADQAIKLQMEQRKRLRRVVSKAQREEFKERKREIVRQKAKDKHRGR
ncbi:YjdF family protein [Paenibacillus sp. YPG26]|uniref:YjdF family protein n=1 Tax=Paenibacillus sp. YPG26 TaxID=2878915 RepID=UPI0020426430|nr:YjdF family protein [Paenibacillus sp. YPG26]USB32933.1 YjdF family protein [Paenibacillus sp. YPG26]